MNEPIFNAVTGENAEHFHRLMQMYSEELDVHQNRTTDKEQLKKWTDSIIKRQSEDGRILRLCFAEGCPMGFLYGKIDKDGDKGFIKPGYGYVMEFYVSPEFRRRGYGRKMLRYLENFFEKKGVGRMYLTADPVTGKPFWEAMGFVGTREKSPDNGQEIYERGVVRENINIYVSDFLTPGLAENIAEAQWRSPSFSDRAVRFVHLGKTESDCFNVIAENEFGQVVGSIFCLQNKADRGLWYYGELFVSREYRRRHIAEKMLKTAEETLRGRWCRRLRCYVDADNTPSLRLQRKAGFERRPFEEWEGMNNEGEIMFEKDMENLAVITLTAGNAARLACYAAMIYEKNIGSLHGNEIPVKDFRAMLSAKDPDERHFLILKGVVPCGYMKINGLAEGTCGRLSMLAVDTAFHRRGVGEYAVGYAENFFRGAGKECICIHTTEDNLPARRLYEKCGYKASEPIQYMTGDGVKRAGFTFTKEINPFFSKK